VTPTTTRSPGPAADSTAPPFPPAPVEELLRLLVKAVRAQQLYLPNNPMYRASIDALKTGFEQIWRETGELSLTVSETELTWCGARVFSESSRSSDNLAWLLYKDGIRQLQFLKGSEESEIVRFLEILSRARKATVDDDDLITMLWEADLASIRHRYVDLLSEGGGGGEPDALGGGGGPAGPGVPAETIRSATASAVAESKASGVVNMAEFDGTLYFLDEHEVEYLKREIAREYGQDLRINIVSALLDLFEQQPHDAVREEVLDDLEMILAYMLASGSFEGVAYLLTEAQVAASRAGNLSPEIGRRIATLPERLSAPEAVAQLLESLDDAPVLPARAGLAALFDQLRPSALGTVFAWLPRVRSEDLRSLIAEVADRLASMNTAELVKLIQSSDHSVSNEAMRRAGALKAQAAVLALGKITGDDDAKRRQIAAQALADIGSPGALQGLERCIVDPDRDLRILAVRAMGAKTYKPILARLEPIIRGREIRDADVTEKTAFFECYGALCGEAGVAQLDTILNGKGFLGRREDADTRAAAAVALGRIDSAKARESLQKAAGEKEVVVRNAVARALRGGAA
jgi:HEAT repeat protein